MGKPINPIRKMLIKKNLKEGISYKQSAINAGYSPNTAINAWRLTVVKDCLKEIEAEFKLKDITAQNVLARLDTIGKLAIDSNDLSVATQVELAKGKFLGIWEGRQAQDSGLSDEGTRILSQISLLWSKDAQDIQLEQQSPDHQAQEGQVTNEPEG